MSSSAVPQGECLEAVERLVVAPDTGIFEPADGIGAGRRIDAGQVIGHLRTGPRRVPVISPFGGETGAVLAWQGERLVSHQPVMWLSTASRQSAP